MSPRSLTRLLTFAALTGTCLSQIRAQESLLPIAHIPDPPPAIDGSLDRFETVSGWLHLDKKEQVVLHPEGWSGPDDLSADLITAWDRKNLYVAAKVKDKGVGSETQPSSPGNRHILVSLEIPRRDVAQRSEKNVYLLDMSPDSAGKPIIRRLAPKPGVLTDAKCAARLFESGYAIEAAIPWEQLGLNDAPQEGILLGLDIALLSSLHPDTLLKNEVPAAGRIMSLSGAPWKLSDSNRLQNSALADSNGNIDPTKLPRSAELITDLIEIEGGAATELTLKAPENTGKNIQELIVHARLQMKAHGGGTSAMRLFLNGEELTPERCRNRGERFELGSHDIATYSNYHWFLLYSPSFELPPIGSPYFVQGVNPYEFAFDVRDLWKSDGPNVLRIEQSRKTFPPLKAEVLASTYLSPKTVAPPPRPAPTGPLTTFSPALPLAEGQLSSHLLPGGAVEVSLAGQAWVTTSSFSTTEPSWDKLLGDKPEGWVTSEKQSDTTFQAETKSYRLTRQIEPQRDHVTVHDTLKNLSEEDVPILIRHEVPISAAQRTEVFLNGRVYPAAEMANEEAPNPTTIALTKEGGIGLLSEDDVMRVQSDNFYNPSGIGIRNYRFVLAAGKEVTLEFSIWPIEQPDRYLLINRIRESWNVNRTIPGSLAMLHSYRGYLSKMSKEQIADYVRNKDAVIGIISHSYIGNSAIHGNRVNEIDRKPTQAFFETLRSAVPDVKYIPYYHSFISNAQGDRETFADAAILSPTEKQFVYGNDDAYPIFIPVEGNSFAKLQEKVLETFFQEYKADGIYWDEFSYSQAKYQYAPDVWDGVTGSIDLKTHKLIRKVSSVTLLSQPWRIKTAQSLLKRGILIGNGQAVTRTETQLAFPRFIETGSIKNLVRGQLGYPIALGDHLTERNERDCYRDMVKGLDFGAVYYWYGPGIIATHRTLTAYMFPATPIALGEGYLIAQERILTNKSGLFGWGDQSEFTAHVFDATGNETKAIAIPKVEKNGQTFAEVRIPEGYAVALVRKR